MIIKEWKKDPTEEIYIRSTVSYPGAVIKFGGQRSGYPYFSPRRYSVIDARGAQIKMIIISASYNSRFDSSDEFAIHGKYKDGQTPELLSVDHSGDLESALTWTGIVQELL